MCSLRIISLFCTISSCVNLSIVMCTFKLVCRVFCCDVTVALCMANIIPIVFRRWQAFTASVCSGWTCVYVWCACASNKLLAAFLLACQAESAHAALSHANMPLHVGLCCRCFIAKRFCYCRRRFVAVVCIHFSIAYYGLVCVVRSWARVRKHKHRIELVQPPVCPPNSRFFFFSLVLFTSILYTYHSIYLFFFFPFLCLSAFCSLSLVLSLSFDDVNSIRENTVTFPSVR